MSGVDGEILREKIRQNMPKPPKLSFGLKAFLTTAIILLILLMLVGGSFIAVIPAGNVGVLDRFGVVFRHRVEPGIELQRSTHRSPRVEYPDPADRI